MLDALIRVWSEDTRFLLDQLAHLNAGDPSGTFTGRIDLDAVGIAGHSFGGATAAQFCHDDSRCRAGIDLDGAPHGSVVREGVGQPFLFQILMSVLHALGGPGGLGPRSGLASTARYVREFFDVHLRGAPRETLYSAPLVAGARFEAR